MKTGDKNSKEKIITTAARLFARYSYDGVGIRQICKEADVNISMISYYFGGKKELYFGIIEDMIQKQTEYTKTFLDLELDIYSLNKKEQVDLLFFIIDKITDFFYSRVSKDLITILLKEQQSETTQLRAPVVIFLRKLIAAVFNKNENDKEMIFKTLFIIAQINSPKILPAFSLRLLGQEDFSDEDIKIITENVKFYIKAQLSENKIV